MIKVRNKTDAERKRDDTPKVTIVPVSSLSKVYDHYICDRCGVSFSEGDEIAIVEREGYGLDTRCPLIRGIFWKKRCLKSLIHADKETFDRYYVPLTPQNV